MAKGKSRRKTAKKRSGGAVEAVEIVRISYRATRTWMLEREQIDIEEANACSRYEDDYSIAPVGGRAAGRPLPDPAADGTQSPCSNASLNRRGEGGGETPWSLRRRREADDSRVEESRPMRWLRGRSRSQPNKLERPMRDLRELDSHRDPVAEAFLGGIGGSGCDAFSIKSPIDRADLTVIASDGGGWNHVSVSRRNRCPNWSEMEHVKRTFFRPDETVMQLHVPESGHINVHPNCLHMWRPHGVKIPRPPASMVG